MEKWAKPQKRTEDSDPTNVVDMKPAADADRIMVRDAQGNVIGGASSVAEAREKHIQANIDAREAA